MKKSILKITVPTLALGLAFAPIANAAPKETAKKTEVHVKTDSKTTAAKAKAKAKEAVKKLTAKEKEAIKKLSPITKNLVKVEASVTKLATATTKFYATDATTTATTTAITPEAVKAEANFYTSTAGKLKANTNQLKALKKQVDKVAKKYKNTDALTGTYQKITDLNTAISVSTKNLTELHTQFKAAAKVEEAKTQLTTITTNITKVETSVADLSKAAVDFYTKAATDATVTTQVESEFFTKTSTSFQENTKQLEALKVQLDSFVKKFGNSDDVTAATAKVTAQVQAVSVAVQALNNSHTQFKPFAPVTTN